MPEWWVISWWAGGVLGVGALVVIALAMLRDRSRGRRRCPKCWYDMTGVAGLKCPECGREQRSEKRLLRTRRRWRMAVAGVLLLGVAGATAVAPAVYTGKWARYTPVPVLRGLLSFFEGDAAVVRARFNQSGLSMLTPWERLLLASNLSRSIRIELSKPHEGFVFHVSMYDPLCQNVQWSGYLGEDARVCLPDLALCLRSERARRTTIRVHEQLGRIAWSNRAALILTLNDSTDDIDCQSLLRVLFHLGVRGGSARRAAERVAHRLDAKDCPLGAFAVRALFHQEGTPSLAPLSQCLSNGSSPDKMLAVSILGRLAHSRDNSHVRVPTGLNFVELLRGDGGTLSLPTAEPVGGAVDLLRQACQDPDNDVRQYAMNVLTAIPKD
jgi:hypothetical protein